MGLQRSNLFVIVGYICAIGVALVGAVVFCGWILGIRGLVSWTGTIDMKTNTAFCFLLAGLSLILPISEEDNSYCRRASQLFALIVLLIGSGTLFEHLTDWNIGIDQMFAQEPAGAFATASPNRMGLPSSICFPLAAISLLALSRRNKRLLLTQMLAIIICLIALLPTIGYLYGVKKLYGLTHYTSISPITAMTFLTLGIGLIFARPNRGIVAQLMADDPGGAIIRRLILPVLLVPLILGFLRVEGERHGFFDDATGTALVMLIMIVSFMTLLWFNAHKISFLTAAERAAAAATESRNEELLIANDQLRNAQEALRESEERFRAAFEKGAIPMVLTSLETKLMKVNPAFCKMLGFTENELVNRSFTEITHPDDVAANLAGVKKMIGGEINVFRMENRYFRKDGSLIWGDMSTAAVRDSSGKPLYIVTHVQDITEHKKAEEDLKKAYGEMEEHVRQRTKQLQNAVESLEGEVSERLLAEQALKNSQHELRSMASEVSLIEEHERRRIALLLHDHVGQLLAVTKIKLGAAQEAGSIEQSAKSIEEILGLVEEALKSTRSLTLELSPPSLYTLGLGAALGELCEKFTIEHGIACSFEDDGKIKALAEDLRGVLFRSAEELLVNVAKHAHASAIKMSLGKDIKNQVELKIEDNGVGFEPSELESRAVTKTGFGLMNIRERINHLGGSFTIESAKGNGTTVMLVLPVQEKKT